MSTSPDTRPQGYSDRQLERLVGNDREFREAVLVKLTALETGMNGMQKSFEDHVRSDETRFDRVNQSIGDHGGKLRYMLGGAAMLGLLIGFMIALARFIQS